MLFKVMLPAKGLVYVHVISAPPDNNSYRVSEGVKFTADSTHYRSFQKGC